MSRIKGWVSRKSSWGTLPVFQQTFEIPQTPGPMMRAPGSLFQLATGCFSASCSRPSMTRRLCGPRCRRMVFGPSAGLRPDQPARSSR